MEIGCRILMLYCIDMCLCMVKTLERNAEDGKSGEVVRLFKKA